MQDLADGTKTLKLGDFGLATLADKPLYAVCGTPTYIAPEVLAEVGLVSALNYLLTTVKSCTITTQLQRRVTVFRALGTN